MSADTRSELLSHLRRSVESSGTIIEWLRVGKAVHDLPALRGDPATLRTSAADFRGARNLADQVAEDLRLIRQHTLSPAIWTGTASIAAGDATKALTDQAADVQSACSDTAFVLDRLADEIEAARHTEEGGRDGVRVALGLQAQVGPEDYSRIRNALLIGLDGMINAAKAHEHATLEASRKLRMIADRATAGQLKTTWLSPIDKLLLSESEDKVGAILTAADAQRAAANLDGWDLQSRLELNALLGTCVSDDERAWILKAVAAGHSMADIKAFDQTIRAHATDDAWLQAHLRPFGQVLDGPVTFMGAPLEQFDGTTCGTMNLLVNHALRDPIYALSLSNVDGAADPAAAMAQRLIDEQKRIHESTNNGWFVMDWPQALGTHPDDAAAWLSNNSGGVQYGWHQTVVSGDTTIEHVDSAITAAAAGHPSMLLIGDGYPSHYVMVVGQTDSGVTVYNPATGRVSTVDPTELARGDVSQWGYDTVYAVITPDGQG